MKWEILVTVGIFAVMLCFGAAAAEDNRAVPDTLDAWEVQANAADGALDLLLDEADHQLQGPPGTDSASNEDSTLAGMCSCMNYNEDVSENNEPETVILWRSPAAGCS